MVNLYFKAANWFNNDDPGYVLILKEKDILGSHYFSSYEEMCIYADIHVLKIEEGIFKSNVSFDDI